MNHAYPVDTHRSKMPQHVVALSCCTPGEHISRPGCVARKRWELGFNRRQAARPKPSLASDNLCAVYARPAGHIPGARADGRVVQNPASCPKGRAGLVNARVGENPKVAERLGNPRNGPVEGAASVWRAICDASVDFEAHSVVEHARDRPTDYGRAANPPIRLVQNPDAEFRLRQRLVMAMPMGNEGVRLPNRHRQNSEFRLHQALVGVCVNRIGMV